MNSGGTVRLACPAKVNLALSVGSTDQEDPAGRHPIASWMVAVDLTDQLALTESTDGKSRFEIQFDTDRASMSGRSGQVDWPLESDLAYRAHVAVQEKVNRELPVDLVLHKRIPTGAGLGGGSSNAAATLVGLNTLFDLGLDADQLSATARELGSDVAFALASMLGITSALVSGFGQVIQPHALAGPIDLVLILPPFGCPTGEVYMAFDGIHGPDTARKADLPAVTKLANCNPLPPDAPFNDLGEPARQVEPRLARIMDSVSHTLKMPVHVTGSGSAFFIVAPDIQKAMELAAHACRMKGLTAIATRTL